MDKFKFLIVVNVLVAIVFFAGIVSGIKFILKDTDVVSSIAVSEARKFDPPTGYQVLEELNKYRRSKGLPDFELYKPLCNNIAERWKNYRETNSHEGLEQFREANMSQLKTISEVLATANTAKETVNKWSSSPSHDLAILSNSKVCVYSADGGSVALLTN